MHLADWPAHDPALIDEESESSDGLGDQAGLAWACRQAEGESQGSSAVAAGGFLGRESAERRALREFADLVQDELNVKEVRLLDNATEAVSHSIKPLPKQLGQKYGSKLPAIQKAVARLDSEAGRADSALGRAPAGHRGPRTILDRGQRRRSEGSGQGRVLGGGRRRLRGRAGDHPHA